MKTARIAVLGIAVAAGGAAAYLFSGTPPPPATVTVVAAPTPVNTVDILVSAVELPMGQTIRPSDLRWQAWPADTPTGGYITKKQEAGALEDTTGAIVRQAFLPGEPIRREKLIKTDGSGFMSAILPPGMRAVAISIDTRGATSAGGFILPNDRVDLIRTYRDEEASRASGTDVHNSETILNNIRILAIGQTVQERNGEKVVTGETATLELTPAQSELVTLGQKTGQISLALRSLADAGKVDDAPVEDRSENSLTVVRFGVSKQTPKR